MEIDLARSGLEIVFKDYMAEAMLVLWGESQYRGKKREFTKGSYSSREIYDHLTVMYQNQMTVLHRDSISRASVINFLNAMVEEGILDYTEVTGKGGHRRIYHAKIDQNEFWLRLKEKAMHKLTEAVEMRSIAPTAKTG